MPPIITLTTDFGLNDPFAGIMKGVILKIAPSARLVDITHGIEPQSIVQAALVLGASYSFFPEHTIHVVVVDPGVGGNRRPIAVENESYTFIGPDNGVLSTVLQSEGRVYELTERKYFLDSVSSTFHGRDIFAPAAAWIAQGTPLSEMGQEIQNPHTIVFPEPTLEKDTITGEVIYIDRFGNLIANIRAEQLRSMFQSTHNLLLQVAGIKIRKLVAAYSECELGEIGAVLNSWDYLEIFCRDGNTANRLTVRVGTPLTLTKIKGGK